VDVSVRVELGDLVFGGDDLVVMAGPCAVESRARVFAVAERVAAAGATMLRGGAFKTRSAPGSFAGLGEEGVRLLREAADSQGLMTVSEVQLPEQIEACRPYIDLFQVGSRNMQHIPLLQALGRARVPVLLKRGLASTIDEWVNAAAYIREEGNEAVILCERGIRTFATDTRFTLDVAAVPIARERSGLPVVVDPSHPAGLARWVAPLALAGVAAGADGLIVEVHDAPAQALSDGAQSLTPEAFRGLMQTLRPVASALGRRLAGETPR
jgi:3-deoxy-7-phosphoheptulonate synthase